MTDADVTSEGDAAPSPDGVLLGKRYTDEATGIEVLCTKPGPGPLTVDGRELTEPLRLLRSAVAVEVPLR